MMLKPAILALAAAAVAIAQPPGGSRYTSGVGPRGDTLPASCSPGQLFQRSGETSPGLYNCTSANNWAPASASLTPPYAVTFTAETSKTATAATHGQGTTPMLAGCVDLSGNVVEPGAWSRNGSGDVTITFATAFSGVCSIFNGNGGGSGGGAVASVAFVAPAAMTVTGSPVTSNGTLSLAWDSQLANLFLASPNGSSGAPVFRAIAPADLGTGTANSGTWLRGDGTWAAVPGSYTLPTASNSTLGGVKVGSGLSIAEDGTLSATGGGGGGAGGETSFTAQTSVTIAHGYGTTAVIVQCRDAGSPSAKIEPSRVVVTDSNNVTVSFAEAQSGSCVVAAPAGLVSGEGGGDSTTVANSGAGTPILKTGTNVTAKTLVGGTNVTITPGTDTITISATGGGGAGTVTTGAGLTGDGSSGDPVRVDPAGGAASQAVYTGNPTSWGTIAAGTCGEKNITATGVQAGDTLAAGWPILTTGLVGMMYPEANLIVVRLCNVTGSGIAVADGLAFSGRVIRGF